MTLNLTSQPGGVTSVASGSTWFIGWNFAVGGVANTGFANLSGIAGTVEFDNGATQSIAPALTIASTGSLEVGSSATLNMASVSNSGSLIAGIDCCGGGIVTMTSLTNNAGGFVDLELGSTLTVSGNVTNNASGLDGIYTGFFGSPGNKVNITGTLTNSGIFQLLGSGDQATIGSLTNNSGGFVDVESGSTLTNNGAFDNSGNLYTNATALGGGNTLTFTGTVTNQSSGQFVLYGASDKATMAGLGNSGYVDVEGGSTFQVNGNATNSGNLYTSFNGTGGNIFNVTGTFTNTNFVGLESTDTATIGGAVNNSGSFQMTGGSNATFTSALTNTGTLDLENASTLHINGTADNFGTFSTSANGGTGGNTVTVAGLLTNEAGAQVTVNGPSDHLTASGGMVNKGTVTVSNGSIIDPPYFDNLGTLNIDGTSTFVVGTGSTAGTGFIQLPNGTYGEMINSATAFGVVDVAGSAVLDGTLDIMLQTGYNPAIGTSFTFLLTNPGQLSGAYATILNQIFNGGTEKWMLSYNYGAGYAQLTAASNNSPVPEPGTFLMLGSALIGVAYTTRRRFKK